MAVFLVRAGAHGEQEELALAQGISVLGWSDLSDLSGVASREELQRLCANAYPDATPNQISNWVAQLWVFREKMQEGDTVVLPLKSRAAIAVGRVTAPYRYRPDLPEDARHTRPTEWLRTDIPRNAFGQDLLYSLGACQTVCQVRRNNAEERIKAVLAGKPDPGQGTGPGPSPEPGPDFDVEQYARDEIVAYIGRRFRGHDLARLVTELLRAQGYRAEPSPPGADGGVDIVAGAGPMGFDPPRLCVQVKSSDAPVDVGVLRELQGVMKNFGAEQGLLVAWGGFRSSVTSEARHQFFQVRLWDAGDLVDALLKNYEKLHPEIQADLPLQRIWSVVPEEQEEL